MARYVGLDRSYFSRLFQERSGVSVSQFRLRPPDRTGAGQDPFAD
ncbi:MAG: helix-turn-helix transcriptional regulator [Spirochaetaceae bacterium]